MLCKLGQLFIASEFEFHWVSHASSLVSDLAWNVIAKRNCIVFFFTFLNFYLSLLFFLNIKEVTSQAFFFFQSSEICN